MPRRPLYSSEVERRAAKTQRQRIRRAQMTAEQREKERQRDRDRHARMTDEQLKQKDRERHTKAYHIAKGARMKELCQRELSIRETRKRREQGVDPTTGSCSTRIKVYMHFDQEALDELLDHGEFEHLNILHGDILEFEIDDQFTEVKSHESPQIHINPLNSDSRGRATNDPSEPPNLRVTVTDTTS